MICSQWKLSERSLHDRYRLKSFKTIDEICSKEYKNIIRHSSPSVAGSTGRYGLTWEARLLKKSFRKNSASWTGDGKKGDGYRIRMNGTKWSMYCKQIAVTCPMAHFGMNGNFWLSQNREPESFYTVKIKTKFHCRSEGATLLGVMYSDWDWITPAVSIQSQEPELPGQC